MRKSRLEVERRKTIIKRTSIGVVLFIVIFVSLGFVSRLSSLQIKSISIRGNTVLSEKELLDSSHEVLNDYRLFLFPKSNIFLYPKGTLAKYILEKYPRIKDLTIYPVDFKSFSMVIKEREAKALWCKGIAHGSASEDDQCFYIDEDGFVFGNAPSLPETIYMRFYGVIENGDLRKTYDIEEGFKNLSEFIKNFSSLVGERVFAFEETKDGTRTLFLENGTKIFFDREQKFDEVLNLFQITRKNISEERSEGDHFEYIDLRFKNKIFYKKD